MALAIAGGLVALTWMFLTGQITAASVPGSAVFGTCGQGLREGGDVKTRGVLIGRIETIERLDSGECNVRLALFPDKAEQVPANVAAQIRAKTIFGEKWVEVIYPEEPSDEKFAAGQVIEETIDPLEVETILNTALPILDAIDPEYLAGTLEALAGGFVGHEDAAIRGIESGTEAVRVANENTALFNRGIDQLAESGEVLSRVDNDLLDAMANLDRLNEFTIANADLIETNLDKAPTLLRELSSLFETRFGDLTRMVNAGATVISLVAAQSGDLDRLLSELPRFNSNWIRNLSHVCRYRQAPSEPGKSIGDRIPGRCWRVHNLLTSSRGPYAPGNEPQPESSASSGYAALGLDDPTELERLLFRPAVGGAR
ncbi:MAG TPA: MCE family protein [Actinomycetota bacterium]|nr:MCE family protein [Actinomycetota bacterium]